MLAQARFLDGSPTGEQDEWLRWTAEPPLGGRLPFSSPARDQKTRKPVI